MGNDKNKRIEKPQPVEHAGLDSLEQLREILFGATQRDFEQRLIRVDGYFASRFHDLEQETRRRIEVLEAHLKKETEAFTARVEGQFVESSDTVRNLSREERDAFAKLEKRITKIEESVAEGTRELRH